VLSHDLQIGSVVAVSGGYEHPYRWLWGRDRVTGAVEGWITYDGDKRACILKLDEPLPRDEIEYLAGTASGRFLVLKLRYLNRTWTNQETVHVEIRPDFPTSAQGLESRQFWVESHAHYRAIDD